MRKLMIAMAIALTAVSGCGKPASVHNPASHPKLNGYAVTYANDSTPNFVCAFSIGEVSTWHNTNITSIHRDAQYDATCNDPANSD